MNLSIFSQLLLGRLLTRSGDQAWDFAVPIILLKIMPHHLRIAAIYYFLIRLFSVVLIPRFASLIDTRNRMSIVRLGLFLQLAGVLFGTVLIYGLWFLQLPNLALTDPQFLSLLGGLVLSGLASSLGASLMDIAIANDLAPSAFAGAELTRFNSRFRQVDLGTEVASPMLAGLLLSVESTFFPLTGFLLIALWNLVSFAPEYGILISVFQKRPDLLDKPLNFPPDLNQSFIQTMTTGWKAFFNQPLALVMISYAFLWLSALSPHGVLLTGFLQGGWRLPEWIIGLFRGSGAIWGLLATLVFPAAIRRLGLRRASGLFLGIQTFMILGAGACFLFNSSVGQIGFLFLILLSRIGLYGFSLGEMQLRQESIPSSERGQVNGFANALTGLATLVLFAIGSLLPNTKDFAYLVLLSVTSVCAAMITYTYWLFKTREGPGR